MSIYHVHYYSRVFLCIRNPLVRVCSPINKFRLQLCHVHDHVQFGLHARDGLQHPAIGGVGREQGGDGAGGARRDDQAHGADHPDSSQRGPVRGFAAQDEGGFGRFARGSHVGKSDRRIHLPVRHALLGRLLVGRGRAEHRHARLGRREPNRMFILNKDLKCTLVYFNRVVISPHMLAYAEFSSFDRSTNQLP